MNWVDKLKLARKRFATMKNYPHDYEVSDQESAELFEALILMTEAIEEVGRSAKTPLIDWDKPQD